MEKLAKRLNKSRHGCPFCRLSGLSGKKIKEITKRTITEDPELCGDWISHPMIEVESEIGGVLEIS